MHTDHARIGSALCTEVDGASVNQLRILITFHSHSTGAADIHRAVILRNEVTVSEFHGAGTVVIEVDDPVIQIPEECALIASVIGAHHQRLRRDINRSIVDKATIPTPHIDSTVM